MPALSSSLIGPALEQIADLPAGDGELTAAGHLSLLGHLARVPDPRKRRGVRHSLSSVLAAAIAAVMAGAQSFTAIGEWIADAPPSVLGALGGIRTPSLLIRSYLWGRPDPFRSVRDLGRALSVVRASPGNCEVVHPCGSQEAQRGPARPPPCQAALVRWPQEGALVPIHDLTVVAEGDAPGGERWYLKAGGSADDYYTLLETVHPDGRRDEGGMGGPVLYPDRLLNVYTGRADPGLLRVIVRADPRIRQLRFRSEVGERCDMLAPNVDDAAMGVSLFAVLLPWETGLVSLQGLDADGQVVAT